MAYGQWGGLRTVVPENHVTALVDQQCQVFPRLAEAWEALKWLLARVADSIGRASADDENLRLYVQADDVLAGVPAIWVLYRVGVEISILDVNIVAPVEDEEI